MTLALGMPYNSMQEVPYCISMEIRRFPFVKIESGIEYSFLPPGQFTNLGYALHGLMECIKLKFMDLLQHAFNVASNFHQI